ncbi:MAG: 50S ribosomal protein L5 [Candidatus Omnitrophica bacterium]|nr:50S ribosomal protein L5 [Candidatus Omnitrophota bacterium]
MSRMLERYRKEIVPEYMKRFNCKNAHQVPSLKKIVINVGIKQVHLDDKILNAIQDGLAKITGQKPVVRKARMAVAGFKLKQGSPCGIKVTLRRKMMYEFFDRLISVAIPRIRDFRGLPEKSFDENGNYSFGLTEQSIFPEIDFDKIAVTHGMDVSIVTNSGSKKNTYELLKLFGVPFRKG